ncbi:hypothetical protein PKHYL_23990 [Psychrobacter sp. KH172YL61]|nr:hypothetical protein PKHYL_23990 [Psychrobacter sp. KH172YL61]
MVAFILFAIGTGPIKGFAVTLAIGIVSSLFTAILVTRALVQIAYGKRKSIKSLSIGWENIMAIENNNPLEQQNNPDRNGSNGDATTASTRRRKNHAVMAKVAIPKPITQLPPNLAK